MLNMKSRRVKKPVDQTLRDKFEEHWKTVPKVKNPSKNLEEMNRMRRDAWEEAIEKYGV